MAILGERAKQRSVEPEVHGRFRLLHRGAERKLRTTAEVGRAAECELRLQHGLVSRRHARFVCEDSSLTVEDLGSRNGVFVNGTRIEGSAALAHGDHVTVGIDTFEVVDAFVLDRPEALSTIPPPASRPRPQDLPDTDQFDQVTIKSSKQLDVLTEREREVLNLLALGHTQKEIAEILFISAKTVESHRAHVCEKLGCSTRAELVSYAISGGLLRRK